MNKNYDQTVKRSKDIFIKWRSIPAPQRGEYIRKFGEELRAKKDYLAETITKEARKIQTESQGEVQEAIDMCDFAVGLSRQLYGLTMPSERPNHRLQELWHPLGVVGCIRRIWMAWRHDYGADRDIRSTRKHSVLLAYYGSWCSRSQDC